MSRAARDLYNNQKEATSLLPANRTADANGSGVDLQGYDSALALFHIGAPGDTLSGSVYITGKLQESEDNTTFTDVAVADMLGSTVAGQIAIADANGEASAIYAVGYIGIKRYLRIVDDRTGTHTNGTPTSGVIVRGHAHTASVR